MRVLVTDAQNRVALNVARALGKENVYVIMCEQERYARKIISSKYSRSVKKFCLVPDLKQEEHFIQAARKIAKEVDIILPVATNTVLMIAKYKKYLEESGCRCAVADFDKILLANNKLKLSKIAKEAGVAVPETYTLETTQGSDYPLVVKLQDDYGLFLAPQERYAIATNADELHQIYSRLHNIKAYPIIQKYIDGTGTGFSSIFFNGKFYAIMCHQRIREYPPSGGPSTCCVSIFDQELVNLGYKLLSALKWEGVSMIEFKKERTTGKYFLMELNPRFWGTLPLALACGVNFPLILCKLWLGEDVRPQLKYKIGKKLRFIHADLLTTLLAIRIKQKRSSYLSGFLTDLMNFEVCEGILSLSDPGASIAFLLSHII